MSSNSMLSVGPRILRRQSRETLGLPTYPGTVAWPSFYFQDAWNSLFDGIDRDNPQDAPGSQSILAITSPGHTRTTNSSLDFSSRTALLTATKPGNPEAITAGGFTGLMDPAAAASGILNSPIANTGVGLADMLLGYVDYADLNQYPRFYTRQSDYAAYINDNWRVTHRLTLNLGLRYEYWTPFSDKRDQASTLDLKAPGGPAVVYAGRPPLPNKA